MNLFTLIDRFGSGFASRLRNFYYSRRGVKIKGYAWLRSVEIPRNFFDIHLGSGTSLDRGVTLLCSGPYLGRPKIKIGDQTYINRYTMIDATDSIVIGMDCGIGPGCYLTDHDHGFEPGLKPLKLPMISQPTSLGDRVWVGANVTVLKGVTIGNDVIVGAGSVVTKNIPDNSVAVGVPARIVRNL